MSEIGDRNLASKHLTGILERRDDGRVGINWGYNSGGYENHVYFVTADGGVLAIDTVIAEIEEVDFTDDTDPQWYVVGYDVNYEDPDLYDDHTGKRIVEAYE